MPLIVCPPYIGSAIDASDSFLLKANGGIVDQVGTTTFDTANTASLSATQAKYGTTSIQFAGNTTTQEISSAGVGGVISGNWTIEAWIYITASATARAIVASNGNTTGATTFALNVNSAGKITHADNVVRVTAATALTANQWNHVALCKTGSGGTATLYINGVADVTSAGFTGTYTVANLAVGSLTSGTQPFLGFIDSVRISKRIVYASNFTPGEFF